MTSAVGKALVQHATPLPTAPPEDPWADVGAHALALATALQAVSPSQAPETQATCTAYSRILDEIARLARAKGDVPPCRRLGPVLTPKQLQDFGHLLRDKRNQAGLSRVQLARKAKLSDATIKFLETAKHPPSRATLLRLVGVPELGLSWADTPGFHLEASPACLESSASPSLAVELHRFDARLSVPLVLDLLLLLDELHTSQYLVEITAPGARRVCCLCHARSEGWAVDADGAAKLPLRHAIPCVGRLADLLLERHPVIGELAQQERGSLRTSLALDLDASRRATQPERFYGCRSGREVAALLTRLAALPATPYRNGASQLLLWALALGPCPVEPQGDPFSEPRARHMAGRAHASEENVTVSESRLQGISSAAAWLTAPSAREPDAPPIHLESAALPHSEPGNRAP